MKDKSSNNFIFFIFTKFYFIQDYYITFSWKVIIDLNTYTSSIVGGINLYITGVTILDSMVELISPPINTIANGDI